MFFGTPCIWATETPCPPGIYTLQFPTKDDTWKKEKVFNKKKLGLIFLPLNKIYYLHGQPSSTFEFLSRVNLSGPSLYCIGRKLGKESRHSILAGATMLTRSDFRLNFFLQEGQRCVLGAWCYRQLYHIYNIGLWTNSNKCNPFSLTVYFIIRTYHLFRRSVRSVQQCFPPFFLKVTIL